MIVTEIITIDGNKYLHTYSDSGFTIERDGIEYADAIDPPDSDRIYTETANKLENDNKNPNENIDDSVDSDEISAEEFMKLVEEVL